MIFEINKKVFDQFPELESDRLLYRRITMEDSESLFKIRSNNEVMQFMDRDPMKSVSESENLIQSIHDSFASGSGINWGIIDKCTQVFIGYFGFWRIDTYHCRGEIGYALHPGYWGKGYMEETACQLIHYGFTEMRLHSIEANVNPDNLSSIKLLEKLGFQKEAYFRENYLFNNEFTDSVIYSLLERDFMKD